MAQTFALPLCHDALYFVRLVRADSAYQATKTHGTMAKGSYEPDRLRVVVAHSDLAKAFEGGKNGRYATNQADIHLGSRMLLERAHNGHILDGNERGQAKETCDYREDEGDAMICTIRQYENMRVDSAKSDIVVRSRESTYASVVLRRLRAVRGLLKISRRHNERDTNMRLARREAEIAKIGSKSRSNTVS